MSRHQRRRCTCHCCYDTTRRPAMTTGTVDVTIGLDVGKTAHHACAMLASGEIIYDKPLPQDEDQLRQVFTDLQDHGTVLMVVDQPNTIGALPIAVARDA